VTPMRGRSSSAPPSTASRPRSSPRPTTRAPTRLMIMCNVHDHETQTALHAAACRALIARPVMAGERSGVREHGSRTKMRGNGVKGTSAKRAWYVKAATRSDVPTPSSRKLTGEARTFMPNRRSTMSWCSFGAMMASTAHPRRPHERRLTKMKHFGGGVAKHDLPTPVQDPVQGWLARRS